LGASAYLYPRAPVFWGGLFILVFNKAKIQASSRHGVRRRSNHYSSSSSHQCRERERARYVVRVPIPTSGTRAGEDEDRRLPEA
jgi:hypothetical protein